MHAAFQPLRPAVVADLISRGLADRRAALVLALAAAALAVVLGLATAGAGAERLLEEGGPVETATFYLYLAAVAVLAAVRLPSLPGLEKAAVSLLLVAFAAREADLHVSLFGTSILKASFYHRHATPGQIVLALAILVPVALSFVLLLRRHGPRWLSAPSRWPAPVVTVTTFLALMVISKSFDRLPAVLVELRVIDAMPTAVRSVLLALEEVLELALPLLAMVAVMQGRQPRPLSPARTAAESAR
jgi:hypothetical protein